MFAINCTILCSSLMENFMNLNMTDVWQIFRIDKSEQKKRGNRKGRWQGVKKMIFRLSFFNYIDISLFSVILSNSSRNANRLYRTVRIICTYVSSLWHLLQQNSQLTVFCFTVCRQLVYGVLHFFVSRLYINLKDRSVTSKILIFSHLSVTT